jgi:probable F420-dependent oxidoreductase
MTSPASSAPGPGASGPAGDGAGLRALSRRGGCPTFGVMMPHFGAQASRERVIDGSALVERLGFDAVWVRDHLLWTPHGHETGNLTFIEPMLALAAVAAVTRRIYLGTAVLIPVRAPLKLAQELATLSYLSEGRVVAGLGAGHFHDELVAAGMDPDRGQDILAETTEIVRAVWGNEIAKYAGDLFSFDSVRMEPKPAAPLPLWYGGTTQAAIRRVVARFDGWIPGGLPHATMDARLRYLADRCAEAGRPMPVVGNILGTYISRNRAEAVARVDVKSLSTASEGSKFWVKPASGSFDTLQDLRGMLAVGEPGDVVEQVVELAQRPIDHIVFDLRHQFETYEESLELIASAVLPAVRASLSA